MQAPQFPITVEPLATREADIRSKVTDPSVERQPFFNLGNQKQMLPVIRVSISLPIYRMANYRTQTAQLKALRDEDLDPSFFRNGEENVEAQRAQHRILFRYAQTGSGDTIVPIYDALKQGVQTQPILITSSGVVVNGNRRLAAMRELYRRDGVAYASFGSVDAMVLPVSVQMDELRIIEVNLQMQPQTLLPYEWVDEALALRELRDVHNVPIEDIAKYKRLEKPSDVTRLIQQLEYAEDYLATYLGQDKAYEEVINNKQQFQDMQKALANKEGAALDASRQIAFVLTKNSTRLGSRAYDYNVAFGKKAEAVLERLSAQYEAEIDQPVSTSVDPFDVVADALDDDRGIIALLANPDRSAEMAESIKAIVDELKTEDDEANKGQLALNSVIRANTALTEVDMSSASVATYAALAMQLKTIALRVAKLTATLEALVESK